LYIFNNIV